MRAARVRHTRRRGTSIVPPCGKAAVWKACLEYSARRTTSSCARGSLSLSGSRPLMPNNTASRPKTTANSDRASQGTLALSGSAHPATRWLGASMSRPIRRRCSSADSEKNELSATDVCRTYAQTQADYANSESSDPLLLHRKCRPDQVRHRQTQSSLLECRHDLLHPVLLAFHLRPPVRIDGIAPKRQHSLRPGIEIADQ